MASKRRLLGRSYEQANKTNLLAGQPGEPGEPGEEGVGGGGKGGRGGKGGAGGTTRLDSERRLSILKYAYLAIVIAATITMSLLLIENRKIVQDIQEDRKRLVYDNCLEQNSENKELIQLAIEEGNLDSESKRFIIRFINTLSPSQNCEELVTNIFGSPLNSG